MARVAFLTVALAIGMVFLGAGQLLVPVVTHLARLGPAEIAAIVAGIAGPAAMVAMGVEVLREAARVGRGGRRGFRGNPRTFQLGARIAAAVFLALGLATLVICWRLANRWG